MLRFGGSKCFQSSCFWYSDLEDTQGIRILVGSASANGDDVRTFAGVLGFGMCRLNLKENGDQGLSIRSQPHREHASLAMGQLEWFRVGHSSLEDATDVRPVVRAAAHRSWGMMTLLGRECPGCCGSGQ